MKGVRTLPRQTNLPIRGNKLSSFPSNLLSAAASIEKKKGGGPSHRRNRTAAGEGTEANEGHMTSFASIAGEQPAAPAKSQPGNQKPCGSAASSRISTFRKFFFYSASLFSCMVKFAGQFCCCMLDVRVEFCVFDYLILPISFFSFFL